MQPYYELAYALSSGSLCFFVGTGFSKYLTGGAAPDWQTLLEGCCNSLKNPTSLKEELFPNKRPIMPLEECASVISLQMMKEEKSIYSAISSEISKLKADPALVEPIKKFTKKHPDLKFITTNYDCLIEDEILEGKYTAFCPGFPIVRQRDHHEVYHIHGAIKCPKQMVVTADDYYKFMNQPSYFSKRLDTLLEENTTIIIGYSLGDINFKSILNAHRYSSDHKINRQHLFFLSRKKIPQHVKDYYDASYGLRVIDETDIPKLISLIDAKYSLIQDDAKNSKSQLQDAVSGKTDFTDSEIKKADFFPKILATIASIGYRIEHPQIVEILVKAIQKKLIFTNETGAWEQYDHLAEWLVQLGCVMDLKDTPLEIGYLNAVEKSFSKLSKTKTIGKPWAAYTTWRYGWGEITFKNRLLIRSYILSKNVAGDYESFINI